MDVVIAEKIAESVGAYFRYDEVGKMYYLYIGQSWAVIDKDHFSQLEESKFKVFLTGFILQEAEDYIRYPPRFH